MILPLGNRLNQGSRQLAGARGIKLSSLNKLMDTKSIDGETFLRFVVGGLMEKADNVRARQALVSLAP